MWAMAVLLVLLVQSVCQRQHICLCHLVLWALKGMRLEAG
jgi:hypothetical protein